MRIAIIQFPGSNCERETMLAVKRAGMEAIEFLWNQPRETLRQFDGYIIVGGFSYEDRSRSGIIAALDPVMKTLAEESEKGKPLLGICNGAQIIVEAGLVPGLNNNQPGMTLTENKRIQNNKILGTGYYNAWAHIRPATHHLKNAFTRKLSPQQCLHLPIAHGEGRFVIPPSLLSDMKAKGLIAFQYCDAEGEIKDEFPINPNGSVNNIAAVINTAGNVMAMMPHPERTPKGDVIFESMRDYIAAGCPVQSESLTYSPDPDVVSPYCAHPASREYIVKLIITDNQALSVQQTLHQLGMPVSIKRYTHWEILCDTTASYDKILKTGVLYNDRKEMCLMPDKSKDSTTAFLVRSKENLLGIEKKQILENHFGIQGIHALHQGILWHIEPHTLAKTSIDSILQSRILYNGHAHDCYSYS